MTAYDRYVFFLCLTVFTLLTAFFSLLIAAIAQLTLRLIRSGAEDEAIQREAEKQRRCRGSGVAGRSVWAAMDVLLFLLLGLAVFCNLSGSVYPVGLPTPRAVKSDSMAEKEPGNTYNTYLYENALDDQLQRFDLILIHALPDEFDLKLYDIVVYEAGGVPVIHRIVGIEGPNEAHPDARRFTTQGDGVPWPDGDAVEYAQMRGIYREQRVPYIGSLVLFFQSPAGWLCALLLVFAVAVSPIVERKIVREKRRRLERMAEERTAGRERDGAGVEK